ncbi:hypothetical protein [Fodinicola acaciae]|uniref:hypothetical protein n=1 Tax=Fodinicola acaciae TaxID=2681555 RepID=UPI0013D58A98|nr:hypothetical protein [Fodinicola acaciae]
MTIDQRTQTAADLWSWSAEIGAIALRLRRFQPESGYCQPTRCTRAVRQLLDDASEKLRARAYAEAGEWQPRHRLARQIGGFLGCLVISSAVTATFSLPDLVNVVIASGIYAGAYVLVSRLSLDWIFRRFDHPATRIHGADEAYAAAYAAEQKDAAELHLVLDTSLRKTEAMLAKIESLGWPERVASVRFPPSC